MIQKVFIVSDDLMDQINISSLLHKLPYQFLYDLHSLQNFEHNFHNSVLLINLNALNIDSFSIISNLLLKFPDYHYNVIAYTNDKHDHGSIHKAKSCGIKVVLEKDQLKKFLTFLPQP